MSFSRFQMLTSVLLVLIAAMLTRPVQTILDRTPVAAMKVFFATESNASNAQVMELSYVLYLDVFVLSHVTRVY